jgi:signal transduction histidine kinase/integral membrane sensor domain MASE1
MLSSLFVRRAAIVAGYGALFLLFDTVSTHFEVAPGVSTWYPSAGLNLGLLLILGARFAPVVFAASFLSGLLIADPPIPAHHLVLPNLLIAAANAAAAEWLRRTFSLQHPFGVQTAGRFIAVAVGLPVIISIGAVSAYALTGLPGYDAGSVGTAARSWWIADAVGILTITPVCLLLARHAWPEEMFGEATRRQLRLFVDSWRGVGSAVVELGLVAAALYVAFYITDQRHFQFYVCFLPLLWIGLRNGLPRTLIAVLVTNAGAAFAIQDRGVPGDLLEFQLFMISLALTGLLLGLLVSERRRAVFILQRASRRLETRLQRFAPHDDAAMPVWYGSHGDGDAVEALFPGPGVPPRRDEHTDSRAGSRAGSQPERRRGPETAIRTENDGVAREEGSDDPERDTGLADDAPPSVQAMSDVLTASSDVLSRSAENLVELNSRLLASKERFRSLNAQKDKLLSLISHDLKNPLVGIRGLTELMVSQDPPSRFERPLTLVQRSAQQALDLLDNLLTWSRLQTGHVTPSPELHRLRTLIGEAVVQLETQASRKGIEIQNDVDTERAVYADPFIVDTVLRNLISNAIKFTDRGGTVRVAAESPASGRTASDITVSVSDTGVGIPAAMEEQLFDMNQQVSRSGTEGENGTGMGLHICRELIEADGGKIWVESEPGRGTTFFFTVRDGYTL